MKKAFLTFLLVIVCASSYAQGIAIDETKDGHRVISTEDVVCKGGFSDKIVLSVSLFSTIDEDKNEKSISLCTKLTGTNSFEANAEAPMLIRLNDGTVLEFKSFSDAVKSEPNVQNVNGIVIRSNSLTLMFAVTESQIEQIANTGVKKVRIGISPDMYDREFKKDKVGSAIKAQWQALKAAYAKPQKSFSEGF